MKRVFRDNLAAAAQGVGASLLVVGVVSSLLANRFWIAGLLVNLQVQFIFALLACLFFLVILRRQLSATVFLLGTLFLALPVIPYLKVPWTKVEVEAPRENEHVYRILNYNVLQTNNRTQDVADYIATSRIDFALLLETDRHWSDEMDFELRDHYPHRFKEPRSDYQGLLFYSKHPWKSIRFLDKFEEPVLEVTFLLPEGRLTIVGLHAPQPVRPAWAKRQETFFEELAEHAAGLEGSVMVLGDFNSTPWTPEYQELVENGALSDSGVGRGIQNTWYRFPFLIAGLPIDHVLTRDIAIREREIGPPIGSDHRPVLVDFLLRPGWAHGESDR